MEGPLSRKRERGEGARGAGVRTHEEKNLPPYDSLPSLPASEAGQGEEYRASCSSLNGGWGEDSDRGTTHSTSALVATIARCRYSAIGPRSSTICVARIALAEAPTPNQNLPGSTTKRIWGS